MSAGSCSIAIGWLLKESCKNLERIGKESPRIAGEAQRVEVNRMFLSLMAPLMHANGRRWSGRCIARDASGMLKNASERIPGQVGLCFKN